LRIKKKWKTGNAKWPMKYTMANGKAYKIPQQNRFGSFCKSHGCSVAAVSLALQMYGISKSPSEVYTWAKKHIGGYTGSKLTVYGAYKVLKKLVGSKGRIVYHSMQDSTKAAARKRIRACMKKGGMVLIEQKSPIHTNTIVATRKGGMVIATNGKLKNTTVPTLVREALTGLSGSKNQKTWFKGSKHASGYVLCYPK